MQRNPPSLCVLAMATFGLLLAGCGDALMKLTGYTHFHVTTCSATETPSVSTLVSLVGQRVAIISDCPTQSGRPNAPRRVSGVHVTSDGRQIPWACETTDAKTISRVSVNGVEYRFADGNTFLISSKGGEVNVLQIQLADTKILDLRDLCRNNSVASNFFSQSAPEDRK